MTANRHADAVHSPPGHPAPVEPLLTAADLQRILGVSRLRAYAIAHEVGFYLSPRNLRIEPTRLREWLAKTNSGTPPKRSDPGDYGVSIPRPDGRVDTLRGTQVWRAAVWTFGGRKRHARARLEITDGKLVCTSLTLEPQSEKEGGSISVQSLRSVPLQRILWEAGHDPEVLNFLGWTGEAIPVKGSKLGWPHEEYERFAAAYDRAQSERPGAPVQRLSEIWLTANGNPVPKVTLRRWLVTCTNLGLVPRRRVGRPKGPKSKPLL